MHFTCICFSMVMPMIAMPNWFCILIDIIYFLGIFTTRFIQKTIEATEYRGMNKVAKGSVLFLIWVFSIAVVPTFIWLAFKVMVLERKQDQ